MKYNILFTIENVNLLYSIKYFIFSIKNKFICSKPAVYQNEQSKYGKKAATIAQRMLVVLNGDSTVATTMQIN